MEDGWTTSQGHHLGNREGGGEGGGEGGREGGRERERGGGRIKIHVHHQNMNGVRRQCDLTRTRGHLITTGHDIILLPGNENYPQTPAGEQIWVCLN